MKLHQIRKETVGNASFGCMWNRGELQGSVKVNEVLVCKNSQGEQIPMQSRVTGYWPDGSIKWTAHIADTQQMGDEVEVLIGDPEYKNIFMPINKNSKTWEIQGKEVRVVVTPDSENFFDEIFVNGKLIMKNAHSVLSLEQPVQMNGFSGSIVKNYTGVVMQTTVEEEGSLQTVLRFVGHHEIVTKDESEDIKIPFIIRMIIGNGSREIRFVHTFMYDGDENVDFLKGLGIRFKAPVSGDLFNRHVKFTGDHGVFHETCVPLISWQPKVPIEMYRSQMEGEKITWTEENKYIPEAILAACPKFTEYSLCQDQSNHFMIRKKQDGDNLCYLESLHGSRSKGGAAFGSEYGSIMMGIKDFWEKYPSGITVKNLGGDMAEATMWVYSPEASAFDFRHYANRGYNKICYEGYDYKGADPDGIACTSELCITFSEDLIPSDDTLSRFARSINTPPLYVATPETYHEMGAFGCWSLVRRDNVVSNWIEDQLEKIFEFYKQEVNQRNWYGLFNYGDFMHTYDPVRHQWRYDIGGYAWDNTELVPTLWLWLYFLRTGREDVFSLAEKLSRHASEVDVYHFGKYRGLGSRHNVRHWGCPCKEARIAMASHHRVYYYLTGDHRLEDIFEELKDNELSFLNKDPLGDFFDKETMVFPSHARSGPDWSSLCSNWMMDWERKNDETCLNKIKVGLNDIKNAPLKLISGPDFEFDPKTCHLRYIGERTTGGTHLQVCMGAPSVWIELADLMEDEEFKQMIADLGRVALMEPEDQLKATNNMIGHRQYTFHFMFSALGAYGGKKLDQEWLKKKAWRTILQSLIQGENKSGFEASILEDKGNQKALNEISWVTTNFVAQWCLNVIMILDLLYDSMPSTWKEADELLMDGLKTAFHRA